MGDQVVPSPAAVADHCIPTLAAVLEGQETRTNLRLLTSFPVKSRLLNDIQTRLINFQSASAAPL